MNVESLFSSDLASEYLRTYREWRYVYGLDDPCIDELKAAIVAECAREALTLEQRDRLECLVRLIDREQRQAMEQAA
jgi:hypothetical protein